MSETAPNISNELAKTSAHGIGRIVTSKPVWQRLLWILLFVASFIGFGFHFKKLSDHYNEVPINRKVTARGAKFRFPDVFICNPLPFSLSLFLYHEELNLDELGMRYQLLGGSFHAKTIVDDILQNVNFRREVYENQILFSSINYNKSFERTLNTIGQTVMRLPHNNLPISLQNNFRLVPNNEYLSCIQFLNTSWLTGPGVKVTMHLFTDAYQAHHNASTGIQRMTYTGLGDFDKSSSMLLYLTESGTLPGIDDVSILMSAGMTTDISVTMTEVKNLNTQKHSCFSGHRTLSLVDHLNLVGGDNVINVTERYYSCVNYQRALLFHQVCRCIPLDLFIPLPLKTTAVRCLNASIFSVDEMIQNSRCIVQASTNATLISNVENACTDTCNYISYDSTWSNALWPTVTLMNSTVKTLLEDSEPLRSSEGIPVPGWEILTHNNDKDFSNIVRDSLIKVTLSVESSEAPVAEETLAYPIFNFFSEVGGILGLYLGVSVLTICELFDLIYVCIQRVMLFKTLNKKVEMCDKIGNEMGKHIAWDTHCN